MILPVAILAVFNILDLWTTYRGHGTELNPVAGWFLERGWLTEAKVAIVLMVALVASVVPLAYKVWLRRRLWIVVGVYGAVVVSNGLQLALR